MKYLFRLERLHSGADMSDTHLLKVINFFVTGMYTLLDVKRY